MEDLRPAKAALRQRVLALRAAQPPELVAARSAAIRGRLLALPEWEAAGCVLLFWSLPGEVATEELVLAALRAGKAVVLPRIVRGQAGAPTPAGAPGRRRWLELRRVPPGQYDSVAAVAGRLVPGTWGILEPPEGAPAVEPAAIDLAVVPGVAFDRAGHRLGYGGGFYDDLLPRLGPAVPRLALAFALQVVEAVPAGPLDVRVTGIVTEESLIFT